MSVHLLLQPEEFGTAVLCLLFIVVFDTAGVLPSEDFDILPPKYSGKFCLRKRILRSSMALANKLACWTDVAFCREQSPALSQGLFSRGFEFLHLAFSLPQFFSTFRRYGYLGSAFGSGLGAVMGTSPAKISVCDQR